MYLRCIEKSGTCSAQWFQTWRTESRHKGCLCPRHRSHAMTWNCFNTGETTEVDLVIATEEDCPGILPCLCQQWHTSASVCPLPPPAVFNALTDSEREKTGPCHTLKSKCLHSRIPLFMALHFIVQCLIRALLGLCVSLFLSLSGPTCLLSSEG